MTDNHDLLSLAGDLFSPVVLTTEWENAAESEENSSPDSDAVGWKATFRRLWFSPKSGGYEETDWNEEEYEIFAPLSSSEKPPSKKGDRIFAVFRGRWEAFESGGDGDSSSDLYGVVMETIPQSSDATAEIPDGMGRVKIFGKAYPKKLDEEGNPIVDEDGNEIEPEYDRCCCLDLAETEKILKGRQVELDGPQIVANPDFDPEQEESEDNPKTLQYYNAIFTAVSYTESLESELVYGGTSTIKVGFGGGEENEEENETETFTVYCKKLRQNQKLPAGYGATIARTLSSSGWILEVMLGDCPDKEDP